MVALFLDATKPTTTATKGEGQKVIGFNNKFARASCYFVHFFAVVASPRHETS